MTKSLLEQFTAAGVSYTVAARDMGVARSTLHAALHGAAIPRARAIVPLIKRWIKERRRKAIFKTAPMGRFLATRNLNIVEVAKALDLGAEDALRMIASGEWDKEERFKKFQAFLDEKKYGEAKKMLTKISLTEEVLDHFGLERDPFTNEMGEAEDIFDTKELRDAERKIMIAVDRAGWTAITGEVGSGKSTLLKRIEERLKKKKDVLLVKPRTIEKQFLGASHVCDSILQDLGSHVALTHRTLEHKARLVGRTLEEAFRDGKKIVILIDEAHLLRDDALLALKRIYEFEIGFKKLLCIILVGQVGLARRLRTNFNLAEVSQRVDLFEIGSLNGALGSYVRHKLERAGLGDKEIFEPGAIKAMAEKGDTPLAVNNVAAAAMIAAWDVGEKKVTAATVKGI